MTTHRRFRPASKMQAGDAASTVDGPRHHITPALVVYEISSWTQTKPSPARAIGHDARTSDLNPLFGADKARRRQAGNP
jgi:hypothetical protein